MEEKKESKSVKLGQVLVSKNGKTEYIALGSNNPKGKPEFNYTVDIRITKANGEKITLKNPKLFFNDPRKFAKNPDSVPDFIKSDVVYLKEDNS